MKKTLFILLFLLGFYGVKASIYYLSDTSSAYNLNIQRTVFKEFNCDILNCVNKKNKLDNTARITSIKIYGIFENPFFDKSIPGNFFQKAISEQIKSGAFVTRLDLLTKDFRCSGETIDTLIVLYKNKFYLVSQNTEIVDFFFDNQKQYQSTAKEQHLNADSLQKKNSYELIGSGFRQYILKIGDTLKISYTQSGREGRGYFYSLVKDKGLVSFRNRPCFTVGKDTIYLRGYLLENANWDSLKKDGEFEFQILSEQQASQKTSSAWIDN